MASPGLFLLLHGLEVHAGRPKTGVRKRVRLLETVRANRVRPLQSATLKRVCRETLRCADGCRSPHWLRCRFVFRRPTADQ